MIERLCRWLLSPHHPGTSDEALIRTHLANERTFLAWLRSSVVLLGVGLGAIALGAGGGASELLAFALGGFTSFVAVLMIVWAYVSFEVTLRDIERRAYRPPRRLVFVATALLVAIGAIILALLVVEVLD